MVIVNMGQLPTYLDQGYDKNLQRGDSFGGGSVMLPDGGLPLGASVGSGDGVASSGVSGSAELTGGSSNGTANLVEDQKQPSELASGEIAEHVIIAADGHIRGGATDYLEGDGFWLGSYGGDPDDYRFFIGDSTGNYLTYANGVLTIVGSITATTGTIGGFDIGSDYIRDVANTFGLASTVSGSDDVRFWAGAAFADRATAPLRFTESGIGSISGWTIAATELSSGSVKLQSTAERILLGSATEPLTGTGVFIGKDSSNYEFRAGDPAGKYVHWDGSTLSGDYDTLTKDGTQVIPGYSLTAYETTDKRGGTLNIGYNDATVPFITLGGHVNGAGSGYVGAKFGTETTGGASPLYISQVNYAAASHTIDGMVYIGTDLWASAANIPTMHKNGSGVTFSGTARYGVLGYDPTNAYLLVMYSTTKIARFSGVSGTTITNVSDITLDTAVDSTIGFIFDRTNSRYICADTTNNLLRRFNSSGTTVDTQSYAFDDSNLRGLVVVDNRVYAAVGFSLAPAASGPALMSVNLVPTDMII